MEFGAFLILGALLLIIVMFVARPFFDVPLQPSNAYSGSPKPLNENANEKELRNRYEDILSRIDEIEEDFQLAKIPYDMYSVARVKLVKEGTTIMHTLQSIETEREIHQGIENHTYIDQSDDVIEEMILDHRKMRQEKMIGFCPRCGKPIQKSDVFCSRCGNKLER